MLPAHIIEELRERELEKERHYEQPRIELPLPVRSTPLVKREETPDRGVTVIDLL
jgi:hypothetical protein